MQWCEKLLLFFFLLLLLHAFVMSLGSLETHFGSAVAALCVSAGERPLTHTSTRLHFKCVVFALFNN